MKIVLATGIYPPQIGGPATYVRHLAEELQKRGKEVIVLTYGKDQGSGSKSQGGDNDQDHSAQAWRVVRVSSSGGPLLRWRRFSKALKEHGADADIVECFSSVSAGYPLKMARLKKPKKLLRLGGDFIWERYTDLGGRKTLRQFTDSSRLRFPMSRLLKTFDHIVFSTQFQQRLYERAYRGLPHHTVIENALPKREVISHKRHDPLRILYFGRFVRFKNLDRLLRAVANVPHATLTMVGDGPMKKKIADLARTLQLQGRVSIIPPVHGEGVDRIFGENDLLILPSITEISPHAALEARAAGLPVLLSEEHGLSEQLREGMVIRPLLTVTDITKAILEFDQKYDEFAASAAAPFSHKRGWDVITEEHLALFASLI